MTGLVGLAGYGFHRVFEAAALLQVLLVAVVTPVTLAFLVSGLRSRNGRLPPLWLSLLLSVVTWPCVVCATLFRDQGGPLPTGEALGAVHTALLEAPHAILSTILPAPNEPELLVLVHAVVWVAAFAASELALRTHAPLLPAVPAVASFGLPVLLGVGGPRSNQPLAVGMVALTALLVLLRSRTSFSPGRVLLLGVPLAVALAVLAGALGPRAPGLADRQPYDLRERIDPPVQRPQTTSPLDQIAAWSQHPDRELFTVRTTRGNPSEVNWRLAVLDRYDGIRWSAGTELTRSGGRVPAEDGRPSSTHRRIEQVFTVQKLPGIWLPSADRPVSVEVPDQVELSVDPSTGTLATSVDGSVGARANQGLRYTTVSSLPVYDVQGLQHAPVAESPDLGDRAGDSQDTTDRALPRTDADGQPLVAVHTFQELAQRATAGSTYPYQQAVQLAEWLRERCRYDPNALPGHSYRHLEFFLTEGRQGTSEQFAASFAVLGRVLGLPTRVAVGFRAGPQDDATAARQVTGADALAWPEVEFEGVGWVPFYPTPEASSTEGSSVAPAGQSKDREQVDREIEQQPRPAAPPPPDQAEDATGGGTASGPSPWIYPSAAVLLLAVCYVLYAMWLPHRRRERRRNTPDPARRVLGAWEQIVERLTEIGLPPTAAHTATEVAEFGAAKVGGAAGEHLPALARLVNEVSYGGLTPNTTSANAAWLHCSAVEKVVLRSVSRRQRARRVLHPRALRRR